MKWTMWTSVTQPRNLLRKSCVVCKRTIWMHSEVCSDRCKLLQEIEAKKVELQNEDDLSAELERIYCRYSLPCKEEEE